MNMLSPLRLYVTSLLALLLITGCSQEPPTDSQSSDRDHEAVSLPLRLAFMSGHVEAGLALYRAGESEMAAPHLLHPVAETHAAEREGLEALGFDASVFEQVSAALESGRPAEEIESQLKAAEANLHMLAEKAGGDSAEIISYLMDMVIEEYAAGVPENKVADIPEYQDAFGFTVVAMQHADSFPGDSGTTLERTLSDLLASWPSAPIPPANPTPLNTIEQQVSTVRAALEDVVAFRENNLSNKAQVNIYSARQEELINPLLERFTRNSGIAVNLVTGKGDALLTRLQSEGINSPADLLLTVDVGRLHRAKEADVLQSVALPELNAVIPSYHRDPDNYWYGLSLRARVIMYSPERVQAETLSSYEALAEPQWKERICIRSSGNIYNQSMMASFIAHKGVEQTDAWLPHFVANFARPPQGGDRDQIRAVAAGICDVAIANSYYLGAMLNSDDAEARAAAEKVAVFFPNQGDRGTHMNVSGAGITKHAPNKDNAMTLLRFLVSRGSQEWYAKTNNEYPVRKDVAVSATLASWGSFKEDELPMQQLGEFNSAAVKAMDRAAWR